LNIERFARRLGHISDAGPVDDVIENWDLLVQASPCKAKNTTIIA